MKSYRILRSVAIAVVLALLVIAIPATSVLAGVTVAPSSGAVGTPITVSGTGFVGDSYQMYFASGTGFERFVGSGTVAGGAITPFSFPIPEIPGGQYTIRVETTGEENITLNGTFTITPKITLDSTSGIVEDEATIDGTGFTANSVITIYFINEKVGATTTDANGSFTNAILVVPESYNGSHTVKVEDAASKYDTGTFSTNESITITPTIGASGDTATVSGNGFKARKSITLTFDDLAVTTTPPTVTTDDYGSFSGSFPVPIVVNGTYDVKATDGTNKATVSFKILAGATTDKTTGNVGTEITVSGTGFIVGFTVTITYDGDEIATGSVGGNGVFSATFKIPASTRGVHTIIATDGTNTKQFAFTMESTPPPIPTPLLPEEGIKAEAKAQFDWEDVEDPSGVTYTLQIATDEKFTDASIVLEKELTDTEYTIPEEEKLESAKKEAPYYWRVRATDGASNEGEWSTPGSFYVGFQWPELKGGLLFVLIGIGAVLFLALGFWLGRRTAYY